MEETMSKPIRSYAKYERREVILRRIKNNAGGLGTLSAKRAAEISAGRHIKKHGYKFEHSRDGILVNGVQYQSIESYFESTSSIDV